MAELDLANPFATTRAVATRMYWLPKTIVALLVGITACAEDPTEPGSDDPPDDQETPQVFDSQSEFMATTGAVVVVEFATSRSLTSEPYEEGVVTLVHPAGFNNRVEDLTPLLAGNEFTVSGAENIDISFSTNPTALGIWMQDAFAVGDLGGCQGADSRFEFTFIRGATTIAGLTVDPPVDEAFFYGVLLGETFDHVEIREEGSRIDDLFDPLCENDFFGSILLDDV